MKIAIISDTHDRIDNLEKSFSIMKERNIKILIHCGDFCAPFMMAELAKFKGDVHCVFGNIDDRYLTTIKSQENKSITLHGDIAEIKIDERKIAVNHYPNIAEALASTGKYDAVFYGHTHKQDKKIIGKTLLLNPGELMGRFGKLTFAVYDTETNDAEIIEMQ